MDKLPVDKPLLVYCNSGARAAAAVAMLARLGFKAIDVNDNFANYRRAATRRARVRTVMTSEAASVAVSSERTLDDASVTATLQTIEQRTRAIAEVTEGLRPLIAFAQHAPVFVAVLMDSFDEAVRTANDKGIDVERGLLNGLIMAEFNCAKEPVETFPVDQRAERFSMYALC